ncbi:MAG: ABC transporter permease [Lachnospiraceae bacterium]
MFQIFQYSLKQLIRNRAEVFWIIFFPIILGTMFKIAFSNLSADENFQTIPVAVINEEGSMSDAFVTIADELSKGEEPFLKVLYCDEDEALRLLKNQKIDGIIYAGDTISLTVSSDMGNAALNQSILQTFVEEYQMNYQAISEIAMTKPEKLPEVLGIMEESTSYNKNVSYSRGNTDTYDQYFYNLIAMVCMYTGIAGCYIAIHNQANLSALGARKNISPTHKMKQITGELIANILLRFLCVLISFAYIVLVLKIDLTTRLPFAILSIFVGCMTGMTFGFFLGAIGNLSENLKIGILMSVTMVGSFLSGLMIGSMRILVETFCPIINKINPSALITDTFYSLAIYDTLDRYARNIITLIILSIFFTIGGFLMTRRKKYANI